MIGIFKRLRSEGIYQYVKEAKTGLAGHIVDYFREQARGAVPANDKPLVWHLPEVNLLARFLPELKTEGLQEYRLIADVLNALQNHKRNDAQLFEVCDIWGFSGWGWTPMMWRLQQLYEGGAREIRGQTPWAFPLDNESESSNDYVHEFLYLLADHKGGRRGFGPNGKYNGTLLRPDALKYFLGQIGYDEHSETKMPG